MCTVERGADIFNDNLNAPSGEFLKETGNILYDLKVFRVLKGYCLTEGFFVKVLVWVALYENPRRSFEKLVKEVKKGSVIYEYVENVLWKFYCLVVEMTK